MDRNFYVPLKKLMPVQVALRKESVDRNAITANNITCLLKSLSARRAWIEIRKELSVPLKDVVALRKESVDRNFQTTALNRYDFASLSARRAWIEIPITLDSGALPGGRSPQGERG